MAVVDALTRISSRAEGEWGSPAMSSEDLVDPVHCSARARLTNTDGDDAIQECVRFRRGLEPRQGSKVVARGVDAPSAAEGGNSVGRAMTQPLKGHVDQRTVVCLQRDAQVQLENAVGAQQQPVTSSRKNRAAQPRAFEVPSRDRHDATNAKGYRPELFRRSGGDFHRHQWSRRHGGLSLAREGKAGVGVGLLRESRQGCRGHSLPPGKTLPRSRGPSKVPLVIGAMTRVPCGTAPSFCGGGTTTWSVISRREVICIYVGGLSLLKMLPSTFHSPFTRVHASTNFPASSMRCPLGPSKPSL